MSARVFTHNLSDEFELVNIVVRTGDAVDVLTAERFLYFDMTEDANGILMTFVSTPDGVTLVPWHRIESVQWIERKNDNAVPNRASATDRVAAIPTQQDRQE